MTQGQRSARPVGTGVILVVSFVVGLAWGAGRGESVAQLPPQPQTPPTLPGSPQPSPTTTPDASSQTPDTGTPDPETSDTPTADTPTSDVATPDAATPDAGASSVTPATPAAGMVDEEAPPSRETERLFTADYGLILSYLKPGQDTGFERTMTRVFEAMAVSPDNERRRQALGWALYKAEDPLDGEVLLYISVLDPTVPGMDYWVPQILNEAFPTEVQELYETYAEAFDAGQTLQNLTLIYPPE